MTRKFFAGLSLALYAALTAGLLTLTTGCGGDDAAKNNVKVDPNVKVKEQTTGAVQKGRGGAAPPKAD